MVSLADLKKDLVDWPDEIIDDWLLYFANESDLGWPPPEPLGTHRWSRILGGRPLTWWSDVNWKKQQANCKLHSLAPKTLAIAVNMVDQVGRNVADAVTKRRYQQALQHILEQGTFYKPIVGMQIPKGLLILDGNHRIGAFSGLQIMPDEWYAKLGKKRPSLTQDAWIGSHVKGEIPLT
ncbi:hypothetical protein [Bradyrhizobium sp. LTSP857]|uniref:hypothetical protein n=1 Tax=Bradyrhizobium sp. LTSP857 TaxID=1619231 RepID=UPI0005D2A861|nr:hypothetical protein [Bradyrhizobium sp. LTSP857]KJC48179.1 hypothetical protein UP06_09380 [Bradyrhizobium sp. LTSP857]